MQKGLNIDLSIQGIWLPSFTVSKDNPADLIGNYVADGLSLGGTLTTSLLF